MDDWRIDDERKNIRGEKVMVTLQYFDGAEWIICGEFHNEQIAWMSLGDDNFGYRTVDKGTGKVLTDKSQ